GLAAVEPVELRSDLVLRAFADRVARQAFPERLLARPDILRQGGGARSRKHGSDQQQGSRHDRFLSTISGQTSGRRIAAGAACRPGMAGGREGVNGHPASVAAKRPRNDRKKALEHPARRTMTTVAMPRADADVLRRREEIVAALRQIVPGEGVIATANEMKPYESDGLTAYRQVPKVGVPPGTPRQRP